MSKTYGTFQQARTVTELPRKGGHITIQPFGDIHRDSHNCNVEKWKTFLAKAKETHTDHTYYIGMGDYNDFASYSERKALHTLHESTMAKMDEWAQGDIDTLCEEMSFMKGHLLGLHHGNHEWKFQDGSLATERMCEYFGCPFLGIASFVRISIDFKGGNRKTIDIFGSHGKGGGRLLGSPYNSLEKMSNIFNDADIYLMGHDHHKGCLSKTVLSVDSHFKLKQKRQWFARTGSFLNGWVQDEPSYVVNAMYAPTDLGVVRFDCHFTRTTKKGKDIIIKDIHSWS